MTTGQKHVEHECPAATEAGLNDLEQNVVLPLAEHTWAILKGRCHHEAAYVVAQLACTLADQMPDPVAKEYLRHIVGGLVGMLQDDLAPTTDGHTLQ